MEHFNDSVQRRILKLAMKDDKDMLKFWAKNLMKHRGMGRKTGDRTLRRPTPHVLT